MNSLNQNKFFTRPNYQNLFRRPPILVSKDFSLWLSDNGNLNCTRFGVIVAKKNVKMAVARNYAKRLARELFKSYKELFNNKDVVLVIKKSIVSSNLNIWKEQLAGAYYWLGHFGV